MKPVVHVSKIKLSDVRADLLSRNHSKEERRSNHMMDANSPCKKQSQRCMQLARDIS